MGCSGCRKKKSNFKKLLAQKQEELRQMSSPQLKTPKQKRIEERTARLARRNARIKARRQAQKGI